MEKYTLSEIKDEKELIIYHHLGIGDHIVCNGLVCLINSLLFPEYMHPIINCKDII